LRIAHQKNFHITRTYLKKILDIIEEIEKSDKFVYEKIDLAFGATDIKK
jgi:hypothetical protein